MFDYKAKPFYLSDEDIRWVEDTWEGMTTEEKIGQLFCPIEMSTDEAELRRDVEERHIGGVLYRVGQAKEILESHRILQKYSKIPIFTASNLEMGGSGSAVEGTYYGVEMLVSATDNVERAYQLGKVSCKEGAAVGVNWAFAPIVDIDRNFRNPITNVRTFGADKDRVKAMGAAYLRAAKEEGVAACIKHFPGDGVDERDQHLLTSVNSLSCEEWDATYGDIYKSLIDEGALTLMAGHIAMPAYEEHFDGKPCDRVIPATQSKNLLQKLLREKLGFNGLISTDATPMVGFCCAEERRKAVPLAIENGCDVFLFNKDLEEDLFYMTEGLKKGLLSEERLEEAVKRILATKAAMGLHEKQKAGTLVPDESAFAVLNCAEHDAWAKECADEGVTLVKDTAGLLPVTPEKHKRVLLQLMGGFPSDERVCGRFVELLTEAGFEVTVYEKEQLGFGGVKFDTVEQFRAKYDLVLYVGNIETASNKTVARISWHTLFGLGNNMPWFTKEIPTAFVSVGNPYHLMDVPMIPTFINGYCNSEYVIRAVVEKLTGKSEFKGKSPVDAFCGRWDTRL